MCEMIDEIEIEHLKIALTRKQMPVEKPLSAVAQ